MQRFTSALGVAKAAPHRPVHALRPHAAATAACWFAGAFPGEVFYAVKANPHPLILDALATGGVTAFDVASLPEIETIKGRFPGARIAYMHPVKPRRAIARAYHDFGVRIFALDTMAELDKIRAATGDAKDLHLIVRLAVNGDYAEHKLTAKFGADAEAGAALLRAARGVAAELGVSFHVGSQCMRPEAYVLAMEHVSHVIRAAGVTVDIVDVGGGFPIAYPGLTPPPLQSYVDAIVEAFDEMPVLYNADLWCEPGRALVAEAGAHIVEVELRKDNTLYINDGAYGALFDAAHCGLVYPARLLRETAAPLTAFELYGPTCDSLDHMKGPFLLSTDIREGDYIEIGQTGAYGAALATRFNGFGVTDEAVVEDAPLMTMYGETPDLLFAANINE